MTSLKNKKVDKTTIVLVVLIFLLFCHSMASWYHQHNQRLRAEVELADEALRQSQEQIFVNCMISGGKDAKTGEPVIWFGTEDKGVFRVAGKKIENFGKKSGLIADCVYALAIDQQGRLWVGTLNQGVCVYNGESWKNYDVVDGPLGERIFDIQVCPIDGDVWMATSAGITRCSVKNDSWQHYTREDGLLEDQASSLAFDHRGNLIVGTQCHGLAFFNRDGNGKYRLSKNIIAPFRFGPENCSPVPLTPRGNGLPSDLVNQVLVTSDSTIYVATNAGLVWSKNDGVTWQYIRGWDYADKVKGLYGGAPKDWQQASSDEMAQLLPEDHVTCLAEDPVTGMILFGTRLKGIGVFDPAQQKYVDDLNSYWKTDDRFIRAIVPLPDHRIAFGCYLGGYTTIDPKKQLKSLAKNSGVAKPAKQVSDQQINQVAGKDFASHPSPIKPPTMDELKAMQAKLESLTEPLPDVYAAYYGEDWKTQGDWIGRAFRDWAVLCAVVAPFDHPVYFSTKHYAIQEFIGPNFLETGDTIRRWIHWIKTDNPRTLYDPWYGYRRQAEWDDHGEAYPISLDGPDLWFMLRINHTGTFRVGMYFMNKDGHSGSNRLRDYMLEVYPAPDDWEMTEWSEYKFENWMKYSKLAEERVRQVKPLAKSRLMDFWGGVHKYFTVSGPGIYFVKIDRNYAFNTILSSVCVDRLYGEPLYEEQWGIPLLCEVPYDPPPLPESYSTGTGRQFAVLWKTLDQKYGNLKAVEKQRKARVAVWQAAIAVGKENEEVRQFADSLKWRLNQWDEKQRQEWRHKMKEAHDVLLERSPDQRKAIEMYER